MTPDTDRCRVSCCERVQQLETALRDRGELIDRLHALVHGL